MLPYHLWAPLTRCFVNLQLRLFMFFKLALAELSLYRCDQLFACDMVSRVATFVSTKDREDQLCKRVPSSSGCGIPGPQENLPSRLNTPTGLSVWSFGKYIHSLPGPTLQCLRKMRVLNATQWGMLYPTIPSFVSLSNFDITLLMLLLKNICGLSPLVSTRGWDILPPASDNSIEANIARINYYRNNVYSHATKAFVDDPSFNVLWLDISNA